MAASYSAWHALGLALGLALGWRSAGARLAPELAQWNP
jgi:hypothetical protein